MKKQNYLCVDLMTYTHETHIQPGEGRIGVLNISEDQERFFFCETIQEKKARNRKVFRGHRLNVSLTRDCRFVVNLKKLELTRDADPLLIADEIYAEICEAMKALGMQPARPVGREI